MTIEELARLTGYARSTVSMALRNHPAIAAPTRARIRKAAEEYGYTPNPAVASLMTQVRQGRKVRATETMAFISDAPSLARLKNRPELSEVYTGVRERARALGFNIDFISIATPQKSPEDLSRTLENRGIRCVLFASFHPGAVNIRLHWASFSCAYIGYNPWKPTLHRAVPNFYTNAHMAIKRLLQSGYRRIGAYLTNHFDYQTDNLSSAAFLTFQNRIPATQAIQPLLVDRVDRDAFMRWYDQWQPEAIISDLDEPRKWLQEAGVGIPYSVAYASLNLLKEKTSTSGVYNNWKLVGSTGVDLAVAAFQRNERGLPVNSKLSMVYGAWNPGKTIRPVSPTTILEGRGYEYLMRGRERVHPEIDISESGQGRVPATADGQPDPSG